MDSEKFRLDNLLKHTGDVTWAAPTGRWFGIYLVSKCAYCKWKCLSAVFQYIIKCSFLVVASPGDINELYCQLFST